MKQTEGKSTRSECGGCPIAGICGGASAETDVPDSLRWRAIGLALAVPLALLIAGLAVSWIIGASQGVSAVTALLLPSVYYLFFYIYTRRLKHKNNC